MYLHEILPAMREGKRFLGLHTQTIIGLDEDEKFLEHHLGNKHYCNYSSSLSLTPGLVTDVYTEYTGPWRSGVPN